MNVCSVKQAITAFVAVFSFLSVKSSFSSDGLIFYAKSNTPLVLLNMC